MQQSIRYMVQGWRKYGMIAASIQIGEGQHNEQHAIQKAWKNGSDGE